MTIFYFFLILLVISAVLFYFMLRAFKNPVNPHNNIPQDLELKILEVNFPSIKGQDIYAWKVESNPDLPTLILVHGWGRNVERMTPYIRKLCCRGFNMLAFDARGHGNSHSDGPMTMVKFAEDTGSAIEYVLGDEKQKNKEISLIGLSIGGASSILAASRDVRIRKVVTVGGFAHPLEVMRKQIKDRYIPYFPFTWIFFKFVKWRTGLDFEAIAPVNNIAKAKADFLLIHGTIDKIVPLEQGLKLKKAQPKAELWEIPRRGHSNCHLEKGFWDKISGFLLDK
ncbi:MAG: alpha/beta hydrolase [Bacteroidales bacterium]|jgi:pimeloyl-ACP methyl ester carboxylesterase|nr:alpha/beta hydrolase [Bacteroidales bacterium]